MKVHVKPIKPVLGFLLIVYAFSSSLTKLNGNFKIEETGVAFTMMRTYDILTILPGYPLTFVHMV